MQKKYTSLGLMSGTSGDGVDASLIISDGENEYESIKDKYFEYDSNIFKNIHLLKEKINSIQDLQTYSSDLKNLERDITIFHAKIIKEFNIKNHDYLIGFHGQTIYHNPEEKISYQLGDGHLLFQLVRKKIIYNFRKNDLLNGGQGAPLTPIFHQLLIKQKKIDTPVCILNIGGISNITVINKNKYLEILLSKDIGPGNCLIDNWIRKYSKNKYDRNGELASSGQINEIVLEQAQQLYLNRINKKKLSYDTNDFDISFARGLSLEDGARTLSEFTAYIIGNEITDNFSNLKEKINNILLCGGGRKNFFLVNEIKKKMNTNINLKNIDDYKIDGDFIESQAFAYLAIRSFTKLPITFPNTTGCKKVCTGGEIIDD